MRKAALLLICAAIYCANLGACQAQDDEGDSNSSSALQVTSVGVGALTKTVDPLTPSVIPTFIDVQPSEGATQSDYAVNVLVQNTGENTLVMQSLSMGLFPGLTAEGTPSGDAIPGSNEIQVSENMPNLDAQQAWPSGPLKLTFPATAIPETTTACEAYDMSIGINATFLEKGVVTREQIFQPFKITPQCLDTDVPQVTTDSGSLPVKIISNIQYTEVTETKIPFLIDFTQKVLESNPLNLFNVTGSNRTDVVYEEAVGKIYLLVYPDEGSSKTITVTVPASKTTNTDGIPNGAAEHSVEYVSNDGAIHSAAVILTAVFAGIIAASWITSFIVSCMQPWATAGSLGYGALGFILWAQKLHLTGLVATPNLPADYRTIADAFAWTNFHVDLPWDINSDSAPDANITSSLSGFEQMAKVAVDSQYSMLYYDGPDTDPFVVSTNVGGLPMAPVMAPTQAAPAVPSAVPAVPAVPGAVTDPVLTASPPPVAVAPPPPAPVQEVTIVDVDVETPAAAPGVDLVPAAPDSCSVFPNTDFFEGDINDTSFTTSDPNACCSACLNNPDCYVWTLHQVLNRCYLKADTGWLQRSNMTCCISGTANRGGLSSILPGGVDSGNGDGKDGDNNGGGDNNNNDNNNDDNKNDNNNNDDNNNRRLLFKSRRWLLQDPATTPTPAAPTMNASSTRASMAAVNKYYVLTSVNPSAPSSVTPVIVTNLDAWEKAKDIVAGATPTSSEDDIDDNPYLGLEEVGFWWGVVFALICIFNICGWLFVNCCEGELPGVLHVPRMQLMIIIFVLTGISLEGAILFSRDYGLVPMCVGIAIVICVPLLFLVACYGGITAAIYRKRKAVYLVSRVSIEDEPSHSKWDLEIIANWMGMSLNRGKWRPPDPSRKNQFVFRWGPLFEDCRGPMYTRRKNSNTPPGATTMRRLPYSGASDMSSQHSGYTGETMERSSTRSSSSRRKVSSVEEPPLANCCGHKVRRSGFQALGVIVSLLRMVCYALVIGGLNGAPTIQCILLLVISVTYLGYLRLVVPYSRRDEMALEYFLALLDIILFSLIAALTLGTDEDDASSIHSLGIGMLVVQGIGYCCYLVNRMLIIVHAFTEVVCPGCICNGNAKSKKSRRRKNRSMNRSVSIMSVDGPIFPPDSKYYDGEGKEGESSEMYMADGMMASRNARAGVALMFPAIAEETDSQVGANGYGRSPSIASKMQLERESPTAVRSFPVTDSDGPAPANGRPPAGPSRAAAAAKGNAKKEEQTEAPKDSDVWSKFWKSL